MPSAGCYDRALGTVNVASAVPLGKGRSMNLLGKLLLLAVFVLRPSTGSANLVPLDFYNPVDMNFIEDGVVLDTATGYRWMVPLYTAVPDSLYVDQALYLAPLGYTLATAAQVCQLFSGNLSGFSGACPTDPGSTITPVDFVATDPWDTFVFQTSFGDTDYDPLTGFILTSARYGSGGIEPVQGWGIVGADYASQYGAGVFGPLNTASPGYSAYWFVAVPEPGTASLLGVGILWMATIYRRNRG